MGDQFTGEPWGFDLILRILDQTISAGVIGLASVIQIFFTILLAISLIFLLSNQIHGHNAWPRAIFMKLFMVWFLTFLTSNWWMLTTAISEDFTAWGIALGGSNIDLGSFYAPSGLILTCFKVIKLIWTHAINGLSITSPSSWFTFGWYMASTIALLVAFYKMVQSVIVAIIQFKIHAAVALMFITAMVWKGSSFLAAGVFGGIFSNAIRLLVLGFLTSLSTKFFSSTLWPTQPDYLQAATIAGAAWLWVWLYNQADTLAAGIINGGPSADGSSMVSQQALTAGLGAWAATAIARISAPGAQAGVQTLSGASGGTSALPGGAGSAGSMQTLPTPFAGAGEAAGAAAPESGRHAAAALRSTAEAMENRAVNRMEAANAGGSGDYDSEMYNATVALGEKAVGYKNLFNQAVNGLDGGGSNALPMSHEGTVEAEAQRASLVSQLGVGDDIRRMTADGKSSRQISEALGDKLSAIDALSTRNNESSEAAFNRVAAVQAYKTAENIPNPSDGASFGAWQRDYRQKKTTAEREQEKSARAARAERAQATAAPMTASRQQAPNRMPYLQRYIPPAGPSSAGVKADFSEE